MKHRIIALALIIFALAVVGAAEAKQEKKFESKIIEIDSNETSGTQRCQDNKQAMTACRSFIKGFIQGALLTDTAIIQSIKQTSPTYAERAIRTRLGNRENRSPTELAGFCLPAERTILELAEETLDHVKTAERNSVQLAEKVYASLKTDYPCD